MSGSSPSLPVIDLDVAATVRGFVPGQKLFNRYVLRKILGRGGMGVVWLAADERLARDVALKFLPETVRLDTATIDDLKHETRRSLKLTHHHIVRIYDFAENEATSAVAMEFVDGATLSALRVERPRKVFEAAELTQWLKELCAALEYAHDWAKIVHRDLKPANIMVTAAGEIKITDFGIARSISDSVSKMSLRPLTSGTLAYMSPQQALGKTATALDDVYSLGATLYELLTSKPPFYSGNLQHQLDHVTPPRLSVRRQELGIEGAPIPESWERTIAACLAKEPMERPQSVREVARRLDISLPPRSTHDSPVKPARAAASAPGKSRTETSNVTTRAHRPWATALLAVAALVIAIGGAFAYHYVVVVPHRRAQDIAIAAEKAEQERERERQAAENQRMAEVARLAEVRREEERAAAAQREREENETRSRPANSPTTRDRDMSPVVRRETAPRPGMPSRPSRGGSWERFTPSFGGFGR